MKAAYHEVANFSQGKNKHRELSLALAAEAAMLATCVDTEAARFLSKIVEL